VGLRGVPKMANSEVGEKKSHKQQLLELLENRPKIYSDAVKWTLARWSGISLSSLFKNYPQLNRESMINELKDDDCFRIINDPEEDSEVIIQLTEKGRDEIIGLFYSKSEQRKLKSLFKKVDPFMSSIKEDDGNTQEKIKP
jgi:hypothetical protein